MDLNIFKPYIKLLPEIKPPARAPSLNEKLTWTVIALVIFFVMYHIYPIGTIPIRGGQFEFLQMIMASKIGSLITAGIGPIILASIFLQLFVGAKIINIDLSNPEQRALYHGVQKLLAIALCFFESGVYVYSILMIPGNPYVAINPLFGGFTALVITLQLALGSILLLYLDEIVSKYGIGSGISLFIAAGVSLAVVQGTISVLIPNALKALEAGGADALAMAILALLPLLFTTIVFLASTYAEGMKVEIPLAFERARGFGGRYPIKFLYVSNIPVILASALMLNLQLWSRALHGHVLMLGGANIVEMIAQTDSAGRLYGGLLYFITPSFPNPIFLPGGYAEYVQYFGLQHVLTTPIGIFFIPEVVHVFTYLAAMLTLCVLFGTFWIETTGMGAKDVAGQLQKSGLQVPGFRRDPRVIEKVLEKYIPTITILGSIFVGLLAFFADLTGALGTGTGILLTVGILNRMYDDLTAQKMFDLYPDLRRFVG